MTRRLMRRLAAAALAAAIAVSAPGCATMRNTKIPQAYSDVGYCPKCRQVMALDGIGPNASCSCPTCGNTFTAGYAKTSFKKRYADKKNQKIAMGVLSAALMAGSIVGSMYGIPIPPPPMTDETFKPYELPMVIECKQASPVSDSIPSASPPPSSPIISPGPEQKSAEPRS